MTRQLKKTEHGCVIFGQRKSAGATLRVQESSVAFQGPHAWIFRDQPERHESVHLGLEDAEWVIEKLQLFIREARANRLCEKVPR